MSGQARSAEVRPRPRRQRLPALLGVGLGVVLLHAGLIDTVAGSAPAWPDEPDARPAARWVAVRLAPATPTPPPAPARIDGATKVTGLRAVSDRPAAEPAKPARPAPRVQRPPRPQGDVRNVAMATPGAGGTSASTPTVRPTADGPPAPAVEPTPQAAPADVVAPVATVATVADDAPLRLAAAGNTPTPDVDATATPPAAMPSVPTYPTTLPPAFRHGYDMRRGMLSGQGELSLQRSASGYEARLEGRIAGFSILSWHSRGHVDAAGFAPDRFLDERRGRAPQAANFRRDAGSGEAPRITYSGPTTVQPLPAGTQDRLSWMLQLAAIAQARPPRPGDTIEMYVSGARGDADVWTFRVASVDAVVTPAGRTEALHLIRAPRAEHETRAEVWLDPARHHLPVRARLSNRADGSDALELELRDIGPP